MARPLKDQTPVAAIPDQENEATTRADQAERLPARIARYSRARKRALAMQEYLGGLHKDKIALEASGALKHCGNYLHFRNYYTANEIRLHSARFCKQHLICPLCAIRRGSKSLTAYLARYALLQITHPTLSPYLITLTVRDGLDLAERFSHLQKSFKALQKKRHRWLSKTRGHPYTEFSMVHGAVGSYEVKIGSGSGLWHPHNHMIAMCPQKPSQRTLRSEWETITKDSFMVDVRPLNQHDDPAEDFKEVFKYALKFSGLEPSDNWLAARLLAGSRLLFNFGVFRGVKIPDTLTDEPLEDLPYFDLFYRYFKESGYNLMPEGYFIQHPHKHPD